jgi:hypothetical protein
MTRSVLFALILILPVTVVCQNAPVTPDLQSQINDLERKMQLEKAENDLEQQRITNLITATRNETKPLKNETTFIRDEKATAEVSALSYDALNQLSQQIVTSIDPVSQRYSTIVIYNDRDFQLLAGYWLYKHQAKLALDNFDTFLGALRAVKDPTTGSAKPVRPGDRMSAMSDLSGILGAPAVATAAVGSVAQLLSMFRSETFVTSSVGTVEESSLATTVGGQLLRRNVTVYIPSSFILEYPRGVDEERSVLKDIADIDQAYVFVADFLARANDNSIPISDKTKLKGLIDDATLLKSQLYFLAMASDSVGNGPHPADALAAPPNRRQPGDDASGGMSYSTVEALMRAEQLSRYLKGNGNAGIGDPANRVGIMRLHLLSSGGSRRETRNLVFGNKIRYSGTVTFEVQVFDLDGTLRASDIFSGYTGFKKFEPRKP